MKPTDQEIIELIPVGEDEFKIQGMDAKLKFNRDEEGVVNGLTLYQNGEHKAKKIE